MKKNIKLFAVAIAAVMTIGSTALVSCNKSNDNGVGNYSERMEKTAAVSPRNANNPYDTIGALHNMLIAECRVAIEDYHAVHGEWSLEASHSIADEITTNNGYPAPYFTLEKYEELMSDEDEDFTNAFTSAGVPNNVILWLQPFLADVSALVNGGANYSQVKGCIAGYESGIMANNDFTNDEKFLILSSTSVLRHSLYYWTTTGGFYSDTQAKEDTPSHSLTAHEKWLVAKADMAGALEGAEDGAGAELAVGTAVGNPVAGAAVGAAVGAVAGGIIASGLKATELAGQNANQGQPSK